MKAYKNYNVGKTTNPKNLADSIYQYYLESVQGGEDKNICLQAVGAAALNQAIKATIIANKSLAALGKTLWIKPAFENIDPASNFTGIRLNLLLEDI